MSRSTAGRDLRLYRADVSLRVLVSGIQIPGIGVLGLELQELVTQLLANIEGGIPPEIGEGFVLLLGHVIAVGHPGLSNAVPPLRTTDRVSGGLMHAIADVIVVADRIEGLVLGLVTAAQQLRVEDGFLG